jgi:hypothetical protein
MCCLSWRGYGGVEGANARLPVSLALAGTKRPLADWLRQSVYSRLAGYG